MSKIKETVKKLLPTDSAIDGYLYIDTNKYEIQSFETEFQQAIDHKGQPQHEVKGGLLTVILRQVADDVLNEWMFNQGVYKDGNIRFAPISRISNAVIDIVFKQARCIAYEKLMGKGMGIEVKIVISARYISINGIEHKNNPRCDI